eukprot:UN02947
MHNRFSTKIIIILNFVLMFENLSHLQNISNYTIPTHHQSELLKKTVFNTNCAEFIPNSNNNQGLNPWQNNPQEDSMTITQTNITDPTEIKESESIEDAINNEFVSAEEEEKD